MTVRPAAAGAVLLLLAACGPAPPGPDAAEARGAQTGAQEGATPPVAVSQEVPRPTLDHLEASVASQIVRERERFDHLLESAAGDPAKLAQAYGDLGMLYHAYGLLPAARACYDRARALAPGDTRWGYYLAAIDRAEGAFGAAAQRLEDFLAQRGDYVAGWVWLGEALLEQERLDAAEVALGRALALEPANAAALFDLGKIETQRGRTAAAIERFEEALAIQPAASVIRYPLGLAYQRLGRGEEARRQLELRGKRAPSLTDPLLQELDQIATGSRVHLFRGTEAMRAGKLPAAVAEFEAAVASDPTSSRARLNLGAALAQAGQGERAVAELEKALELGLSGENLSKTHFNLGALHAMAGRLEPAEEHLRQSLRWNPGNSAARALLARVEAAAGKQATEPGSPSP